MPGDPLEQRQFTDREVGEILKQAVEHSPGTTLAKTEGTSLADLRAIAQEVGIDPSRLEAAARAVAERGQRAGRFLGFRRFTRLERRISGQLDPHDSPDILARIRHAMGRHGEVEQIHDAIEWTSSGESGTRHIAVSTRDGTTTIRASADMSQLAVVSYLPAGLLGTMATAIGIVTAAGEGSVAGLFAAVAALPVAYGVARTIVTRVFHSESAKLRSAVDEVAAMVEESGGRTSSGD